MPRGNGPERDDNPSYTSCCKVSTTFCARVLHIPSKCDSDSAPEKITTIWVCGLSFSGCREIDIVGIFRYTNTWPLCIEFMESGKIDVKPLITHRFEFRQEQVEEAFETSARGGNAIKVMFSL